MAEMNSKPSLPGSKILCLPHPNSSTFWNRCLWGEIQRSLADWIMGVERDRILEPLETKESGVSRLVSLTDKGKLRRG